MLRIIREVQPTWVVAENVFGLINWNGGLVFDEVQTDLEAEGYEVQPYVLPAASVNAPHERDRVWFVAHRTNSGTKEVQQRRENGICRHRTPKPCWIFDDNMAPAFNLSRQFADVETRRLSGHLHNLILAIYGRMHQTHLDLSW